MSHLLRFVDSIQEAANVRLDLNDSAPWITEYDNTDFTPPPLRRTTTSSQLADGALVTSAVYENREITIGLRCVEDDPNVIANHLAELHKELERPTNLLQLRRVDAFRSVFFRTLRSDYSSIEELPSAASNHFRIQVRLIAEPFGIGPRINLPSATVSGTIPAAATIVVPGGIGGDVETPLLIRMKGTSLDGSIVAMGTRRRGSPGTVTYPSAQAGSIVPGLTDTYAVEFNWPTVSDSASTEYMGDYRVFASASKSVAATVLGAHVRSGTAMSQECRIDTTSTSSFWCDLGVISVPGNSTGVTSGYDGPLPAKNVNLKIYARRISGAAATLTFNSFYLVPADQELCMVRMPDLASTGTSYVLDGPNDALYQVTPTGELRSGTGPFTRSGKLPMLSPGAQQTQIIFLNGIQGSTPAGTGAATVELAYWPRYRHIASQSSDVYAGPAYGTLTSIMEIPFGPLVGATLNGAVVANLPLLTAEFLGGSSGGSLTSVMPLPDMDEFTGAGVGGPIASALYVPRALIYPNMNAHLRPLLAFINGGRAVGGAFTSQGMGAILRDDSVESWLESTGADYTELTVNQWDDNLTSVTKWALLVRCAGRMEGPTTFSVLPNGALSTTLAPGATNTAIIPAGSPYSVRHLLFGPWTRVPSSAGPWTPTEFQNAISTGHGAFTLYMNANFTQYPGPFDPVTNHRTDLPKIYEIVLLRNYP